MGFDFILYLTYFRQWKRAPKKVNAPIAFHLKLVFSLSVGIESCPTPLVNQELLRHKENKKNSEKEKVRQTGRE